MCGLLKWLSLSVTPSGSPLVSDWKTFAGTCNAEASILLLTQWHISDPSNQLWVPSFSSGEQPGMPRLGWKFVGAMYALLAHQPCAMADNATCSKDSQQIPVSLGHHTGSLCIVEHEPKTPLKRPTEHHLQSLGPSALYSLWRIHTHGWFLLFARCANCYHDRTKRRWQKYRKWTLEDLSSKVRATDNVYFACGGFSTVWKGEWVDPADGPPHKVRRLLFGWIGALIVYAACHQSLSFFSPPGEPLATQKSNFNWL